MDNEENKHPNQVRRERKLIMILAVVLFLCIGFYVYSLTHHAGSTHTKTTNVVLIKKNHGHLKKANSSKKESGKTDTKKPNVDRPFVTDFINQYFAFDEMKPQQHVKNVRMDLTPAFYKALLQADTNDTHRKPYAYRKVEHVSYASVKKVGSMERYLAAMTCQLYSGQKKTAKTIMDISVDVSKKQGKTFVSYFAVSGKHVIKNE